MPQDYQKKRIPYGFSFLDVSEARDLKEKSYLTEKILIKANYQPVLPSTLDYQETFEVFGRKDIFHLKDHLGDRLALRNDATIQVIKGFCHQLERESIQSGISRYFYHVPVFTDIQKNYPSLREVHQIGAEMIGADTVMAICELLVLLDRILNEVFSVPYYLIIGDVRIFHAIQEHFPGRDLSDAILKRDSHDLISLMNDQGWEAEDAFIFVQNMLYCKGYKELVGSLNELSHKVVRGKKNFLNKIIKKLEPLKQLKDKLNKLDITVDLDPLILRRPKYYTSFVFAGYTSKLSFPPLRGGAYDDIISVYSNQNYNASGFALDVSSII